MIIFVYRPPPAVNYAVYFILTSLFDFIMCVNCLAFMIFIISTTINILLYIIAFTKITQQKFEQVRYESNEDETVTNLKDATKCHQQLLSLHRDMNKLCSIQHLFQVLSALIPMSLCIFIYSSVSFTRAF